MFTSKSEISMIFVMKHIMLVKIVNGPTSTPATRFRVQLTKDNIYKLVFSAGMYYREHN